jgi:hypothetical protein
MSFLDKLADEYAEAFTPVSTINVDRERFREMVAPQLRGHFLVAGDTIAVTYTALDSTVTKVSMMIDFPHEIDDKDIDSLFILATQNDVPEKCRKMREVFEGGSSSWS